MYSTETSESDCILHGYLYRLGGIVTLTAWQKKYFYLYPNRLEWRDPESVVSFTLYINCKL